MSDRESVICPVFLAPFDADKHTPKIFPTCGHTVCEECLVQVLEMSTPKCPLDKLKFGYEFREVEAFPTNFLGKDLLQKHGKWTRCSAHSEKNKLICLTDQTLICTDCVIDGDHQGHEIKPLSELEGVASQKENLLSDLLKKITAKKDEVENSIQEKGQATKEAIKERFRHLRTFINKQEVQMLFELESVLAEEKMKFETNRLGERIPEIEKKLDEFSRIMANPNIMKMLEEDFTELENTVNKEITLNSQKIEEFTNLLGVFENSLPKEDLLKNLKVIDNLNKSLLEFKEKRKFDSEEGESQEIEISAEIRFELKDDEGYTLEVGNFREKKTSTFKMSDLEQVQKVEYNLSLKELNEEEEDPVLPALLRLSKFLPNANNIIFEFDNNFKSPSHCDERCYNIISAALARPENVKKIEVTFNNSVVGDLGFLALAENILPKIKDLNSFSIKMMNLQFSSQFFSIFANVNWKAWSNLETFRFNLPEVLLEANDVIKFLSIVPNVKDILLGFGKTKLTDKAIENFSTKILPSLDKLERLEIGFWKTQLTKNGVEKFLMNIPNVKNLLLGMDHLEMTDEIIKRFLDQKLPTLTRLKELQFKPSQQHLSRDIMRQIEDWERQIAQRNRDNNDE